MKNQYTLRPARPDDIGALVELCAEHAAYEQAEYSPEGKAARLAAHLFKPEPSVHCLVAEANGQVVGYATYSKEFSTWDAGHYLHMDCLYLKDTHRGLGIGEEIVKRIADEARKLGISLLQWQTPDTNTRAIRFYQRLGATAKAKLRMYLASNTWKNHS